MNDFNICLIGDEMTGKSTFLNYVINNVYKSEYESTIGVDFSSKLFQVDNHNIKWKIWDTTGNRVMMSVFYGYIDKINIFLLFFDNNKCNNINRQLYWINYIKTRCHVKYKIFLISNNPMSSANISSSDVNHFCNKYNLTFIEGFLKNKESINNIVFQVNKYLISKIPNDKNSLNNTKKNNKNLYFELEESKKDSKKCCVIM